MPQLFIDGKKIQSKKKTPKFSDSENGVELRPIYKDEYTLFPTSNIEVIEDIAVAENLETLTILDIDFSESEEAKKLSQAIVSSPVLRELTVCNCYSINYLLQALVEKKSSISNLTISFDPTCTPDYVEQYLIAIIEKNKILESLVIHFNLDSEAEELVKTIQGGEIQAGTMFRKNNKAFQAKYSKVLDNIINSLKSNKSFVKFEFFPRYKQDEIDKYLEANKKQAINRVFVNSLVSYLHHNSKTNFEEFFSHLEIIDQSNNVNVTIRSDHPAFNLFRTGFFTQIVSKNITARKTASGAKIISLQIKNDKGKSIQHTKITLKDSKITIFQNFQSLQIFKALATKVFDKIMMTEVSQKSEISPGKMTEEDSKQENPKSSSDLREQLFNIGKFIWYLVHCVPYLADGNDWKVNVAVRALFAKFDLPFQEKFPIYQHALVEFTAESFAEYFVARYRELLSKTPEEKNNEINLQVSKEVEKFQTALIPFLTDKSIFKFSFGSKLSIIMNALNRDLNVFHGMLSRLNNSPDQLIEAVLVLVEPALEKFYGLEFSEQNPTCARILVHARDSLIKADFNKDFPSLVADNTVSITSSQVQALFSCFDGRRIYDPKSASKEVIAFVKEGVEILGEPEAPLAQTFLPITIEKIGEIIDKQTQLEFLELTNVNFTGRKEFAASLAKKIAEKSSLQTLVLYACRSIGVFLVELGNLKLDITDLRIRFIDNDEGLLIKNDNGLGFVPAIIQNCKDLQTLVISISCKYTESFIEKEKANLDSIIRAVGSNMKVTKFELFPTYKFNEITTIMNSRKTVASAAVSLSESESQKAVKFTLIKTIIDYGVELLNKTPDITCKEFFNWIARNFHMVAVICNEGHIEEKSRQRTGTLESHINSAGILDGKIKRAEHPYFGVFKAEYLKLKPENLKKQGEYTEFLISCGDIEYSKFRFLLNNNEIQKIIIDHTMPGDIDYDFQELQNSFDFVIHADEQMSTVAGRATFLIRLFEIVWKVSQLSPYVTDNDAIIEVAIRIFFDKNGFEFPVNIPLMYPRALISMNDAVLFKDNVNNFSSILRVSADDDKSLVNFNKKIEENINRLLTQLEHFSSKKTQQISFFSKDKTSAHLVDDLISNLNLLKNSKMESDLFLFNTWITINAIKIEYEKLFLSNPICLEILKSVEQQLGEIKLEVDENKLLDFVPEVVIEEDKPPFPQRPLGIN